MSHPVLPEFVARHIGPSEEDVAQMLSVVGQQSLESLADVAVPGAIRSDRALHIDPAAKERDAVAGKSVWR
jgi:glycine dehydrogenase